MAAEAEAAREARAKVGTSSLALYLSLYKVRPSSPCSQKYIISQPGFFGGLFVAIALGRL
jgi:hypothetical protein